MLGVRCVALRGVALRGVACVALESRCPGASLGMGTALLISSFCWLPHRSSARKRGDNCRRSYIGSSPDAGDYNIFLWCSYATVLVA